MRSRLPLWLTFGLILAAVLLAVNRNPASVLRLADRLVRAWQAPDAILGILFVIPGVLLILLYLVLTGPERGPFARARGELERLLSLKNQGTLSQRSRRIRENAARTSRRTAVESGLPRPTPVEQDLERLVQLKRRGIWGTTVPETEQGGSGGRTEGAGS
jgi:hypothetical protein